MHPSDFQKKVWFNALTAIAIASLGCLFVAGIWLTGEVLAYLQPVLVPLAVAGIMAYLFEPVVSWLERRRMSRVKAILSVFLVSALGIVAFSWMIAVPLGNQIKKLSDNSEEYLEKGKMMVQEVGEMEFIVQLLPEGVRHIIPQKEEETAVEENTPEINMEEIGETNQVIEVPDMSELLRQHMNDGAVVVPKAEEVEPVEESLALEDFLSADSIIEFASKNGPIVLQRMVGAITRGTSKFFGILGYALGFVMVPIYLFFFLKESVKIQENWQKFVPLRASKFKDEVVSVVSEINDYLIAFFRGQLLVSVIDGVLVGLVLKFFGHPFAILIGISLAILGVIPFVGNIICLVPAAVTAYAHFSLESEQYWLGDSAWAYVIMVVVVFIVVQQINSLVTAPKIVGDSVGLHPMTVIFSMLFWSLLLGGFLGALLAVPLTASVKVLFSRYVWERRIKCALDTTDEGELAST